MNRWRMPSRLAGEASMPSAEQEYSARPGNTAGHQQLAARQADGADCRRQYPCAPASRSAAAATTPRPRQRGEATAAGRYEHFAGAADHAAGAAQPSVGRAPHDVISQRRNESERHIGDSMPFPAGAGAWRGQ